MNAPLLLVALTLAAAPVPAQTAGEPRVWEVGAGRWVAWGTMADSLARHDVVVVGEQHDDRATHRAGTHRPAALKPCAKPGR